MYINVQNCNFFHVFSVMYSYNCKYGDGKIMEKEGDKIPVNIYGRSQQFCVKNKKECVYHNDHCEYEHGNMPMSSKPTLWTTCGVQTISSMAKIAVASV